MTSLSHAVFTVDRSLAERHEWGSIQWLASDALVPGAQITVGWIEILPGRSNPRHLHQLSDEVLTLLAGELEHEVAGNTVHLEPGMSLFIAAGTPHQATNASPTTAQMLVSYPTGRREIVLAGGD